jgi:hypothetical protein
VDTVPARSECESDCPFAPLPIVVMGEEEDWALLRAYQYHSSDPSRLAPWLNEHVWQPLSTHMPQRLSPNVITLTGLACSIVNVCLCVAYTHASSGDSGDAATVAPPYWVYPVSALLLCLYQTLDALDGLQGKRVGMYNNATTELFDHGCDSWSLLCTMTAFTHLADCTPIEQRWWLAVTTYVFLSSTYTHTCTGIMTFGSGLRNPTEASALMATGLLFAGVFRAWAPLRWIISAGGAYAVCCSFANVMPAIQEAVVDKEAEPRLDRELQGALHDILQVTCVLPLLIAPDYSSMFWAACTWAYAILILIECEVRQQTRPTWYDFKVPVIMGMVQLGLSLLSAGPAAWMTPVMLSWTGATVTATVYSLRWAMFLERVMTATGMRYFWSLPDDESHSLDTSESSRALS